MKTIAPHIATLDDSQSENHDFWWDYSQNRLSRRLKHRHRYGQRRSNNLSPIHEESGNPADSEDDYDLRREQRKKENILHVIEETTDSSETEQSSTETDIEENPSPIRASDTIPTGIFYPEFRKQPDSKLKVKLINQSLKNSKDNILHFTSADC